MVSVWVSPWISIMVIMIYYFPRGSPSGSMTNLIVKNCVGKCHVMFFGIFEKAPNICVDSTLSIFIYVFWMFSFPCSRFRVKIVIINGNHHVSIFVYPVGDFTQIFTEIFSDGSVFNGLVIRVGA